MKKTWHKIVSNDINMLNECAKYCKSNQLVMDGFVSLGKFDEDENLYTPPYVMVYCTLTDFENLLSYLFSKDVIKFPDE